MWMMVDGIGHFVRNISSTSGSHAVKIGVIFLVPGVQKENRGGDQNMHWKLCLDMFRPMGYALSKEVPRKEIHLSVFGNKQL